MIPNAETRCYCTGIAVRSSALVQQLELMHWYRAGKLKEQLEPVYWYNS
jgi:hypothetical protein